MTDALKVDGVSHLYGAQKALSDISLTIPKGQKIAFIGPDGTGKSTLLALIATAKKLQTGEITILGGNARNRGDRRTIQSRLAYMPQGLGRNLYADLTVRENMEFFGRLFGLDKAARDQLIEHLLAATGLTPFPDRAAGKLSGGMRQKLSLCCALIHNPDLLILDEPTTGVDPLSRRQFWTLIEQMRAEHKGLTVLVATSYMEEAESFDRIVMLNAGAVLADGTPQDIMKEQKTKTLEEAFITLLPQEQRDAHKIPQISPYQKPDNAQPAIEARGLTRSFGAFTAVDHVSFLIPKGEIFGFLGSNGCGKTTTMKMLTGLLPSTNGETFLFGKKLDAHDIDNRKRIGYMSQFFSLYGELTVLQNLHLHARIFQLTHEKEREKIDWIGTHFDLKNVMNQNAGDLPLGIRQRLSLAVAVLHDPEVLILDEPTSGVDPIARDNFWVLLIELSRTQGVTIFISTHFLNEAARCDRISLMHAGHILATDKPDALQKSKQAETLELAFIAYLEDAAHETTPEVHAPISNQQPEAPPSSMPPAFCSRRMNAYFIREMLELIRDPVRLSMAILGTVFLMIVFGYGITLDVNSLSYAMFDRDGSSASRHVAEAFSGSSYFDVVPPIKDNKDMDYRMAKGEIALVVETPPSFGRKVRKGEPTTIGIWIDGSMPFRAETVAGYVQGVFTTLAQQTFHAVSSKLTVVPRYRYNQGFTSATAMVPAIIALLLIFIPAILSALSIVREKEMGSIINLYVTPVSRLEFMFGKQAPYIIFAFISYLLMVFMAVLLFDIPLGGSFLGLSVAALLYVIVTTSVGFLISSFTKTQVAALFGTAILTILPATQFSGLLQPVSTLEGLAYAVGIFFPTTYFLKCSVGVFAKGLGFVELNTFLGPLLLFIPVLIVLNLLLLRKQEA